MTPVQRMTLSPGAPASVICTATNTLVASYFHRHRTLRPMPSSAPPRRCSRGAVSSFPESDSPSLNRRRCPHAVATQRDPRPEKG
jgi:hypothetical protein